MWFGQARIDSIRFASLGFWVVSSSSFSGKCVFGVGAPKNLGEIPITNPTFFVCFHPFWQKQGISSFISVAWPNNLPPLVGCQKKTAKTKTDSQSPHVQPCEGPSVTLDPYPAAMGPTSPIVCRTRRDYRLVQVNPVRPRVMDFHHGNLRAPSPNASHLPQEMRPALLRDY